MKPAFSVSSADIINSFQQTGQRLYFAWERHYSAKDYRAMLDCDMALLYFGMCGWLSFDFLAGDPPPIRVGAPGVLAPGLVKRSAKSINYLGLDLRYAMERFAISSNAIYEPFSPYAPLPRPAVVWATVGPELQRVIATGTRWRPRKTINAT